MKLAFASRSSIVLPAGDPFSGCLPGSEVSAVNVMKALQSRNHSVRYFGAHRPGAVIEGVQVSDFRDIWSSVASPGARMVWIRDYSLPQEAFNRLPGRHVLWSQDSIADLQHILDSDRPGLRLHFARYLQNFDHIVFASEWHRRNWQESLELNIPSTVVYNLASHVPVQPNMSGPLERVVHTSHPRKALPIVGEIARRLQETNIRVACFGSPALYQDADCLMSQPATSGADRAWSYTRYASAHKELIDFHDPVPVNSIAAVLRGFGTFLHPDSSGECGATALVEALRAGLVPVVSSTAAVPELVGDAGLVIGGEPGTGSFIGDCTRALLGLDEARRKHLQARRQRAIEKLGFNSIASSWEEILD